MKEIVVTQRGKLWDLLNDPEHAGAVLTGSRAFGVSGDDSDYDYFITEDQYAATGCTEYYTDSTYEDALFNCVKFRLGEQRIDLLIMKPTEARAWRFANNAFYTMVESDPRFRQIIKVKEIRVRLFESFKTAFRDYIETRGES
jgi:hypothetical protein